MLKRIISGLIGFILLLLVVIRGGIILNLAVLIVTLTGLYEFYNAVSKINVKPVNILSYLFTFGLFYIAVMKDFQKVSVVLFLYIVALMIVFVIKKELTFVDIGVTLLGGLYIAFFMFHIGLLSGNILIWLIFITAWGTDTFAYFTGIFFGKRKLCPDLSPKKTVEGSIGGVIGTLLITFLFLKFFNIGNILEICMISVLCSIIAQIGDLAASKVKRIVEIKDYGTIMPGHGGVLDRFDSILIITPIIYYYIVYLLN